MAGKRDVTKRLKGFGIPIATCVKYERCAGVKPGNRPNKEQAKWVSYLMVKALNDAVSTVPLTKADYEQIAKEIKANETRNRG